MGWGIYVVLNILSYRLTQTEYSPIHLLSLLFFSLTGLGVTHYYRTLVKRWKLNERPLIQVINYAAISVLLMAVIITSLSLVFDIVFNMDDNASVNTAYILNYFFASVINAIVALVIWALIYHMVGIFQRVRAKEIESLKLETTIKDIELKQLKSQLNPHFVFNALNSIRALVYEDPAKAQTSITQLSNLLRNALMSDRSRTVSLQEELKTVADYLNLEKLRYEERMRVQIMVDDRSLAIQVPPMMVQTVVENAVKHGINKVIGAGFIEVESKLLGDSIEVHVRNSGKLGTGPSESGFGIVNTRERLRILYGSAATFDIYQQDEQTVDARLVFPLKPLA